MSMMHSFKSLPRALRWLIGLGVFVIAYFGVIEPVLGYAQAWQTRASTLETALARDKELASGDGDGGLIQQGQSTFGRPHMPGVKETSPESLYRLVNSLLEAHGVTERSVSERSVPMTGDLAAELKAGTITRLILDVSFEADVPTVISIISELERSKEVAALGRVKLDKSALRSGGSGDDMNDIVRATISAEAWTTARGGNS